MLNLFITKSVLPLVEGEGDKGNRVVVKSNICPVCLADIPGEYIEEGDLRIADEAITCPSCGYTLEGVVDECPEPDELDKEKEIGLSL